MIGPDPIEILDALGIGWGVHELYPNPVEQHAFVSAVRRLEVLHDTTLTYEIGAGSVTCDGEKLTTTRGGTERLLLRLFVHEVEWLELLGVPSAEDLSLLFALLAADEQEIRADGGIGRRLQQADVWSIAVTQRGLLTEIVDNPWERREEERGGTGGDVSTAMRVAHLVADGAKPHDVAAALVEGTEGEPGAVADSFCLAYRVIYPGQEEPGSDAPVPEMLSAYRPTSRGRPPIDTFAEAFFLLPEAAQAEILSDFLTRRQEGMHALLLDQFAGAELAKLAPLLEPEAYETLLAYARDVVESEAGSADELLPMVSAARDVRSARLSAASRIREMIEGIGGLGSAKGGLAGQLRDESAKGEELGFHVLRSLFEVEDRPDRFSRLVHHWCGRISKLVHDGDMDRALAVARIGTEQADLSPAKRGAMEGGLIELLRSDYAVFHEAAQDPERRDALAEILERFGEPAAAHLMERLSVEEDASTRRVLIGLLVVVGSGFSEPIARFFRDPRWYVVRNAVSIAGKIGGRKWVPYLKPLFDHADHRVVIEAMRALTPLSPDEAVPGLVKCLGHEHERVRETAYLLVQSSSSPVRGPELASALTDSAMDIARPQIATLLFELGTPEALDRLQQVARTLAVSPTKRHARRAAREVLRSAA
jgi:hypothetical protein